MGGRAVVATATAVLVFVLAAGPAGSRPPPKPPETPYPGGRWQPEPPRYGVAVTRNVRIRMSDGVRLVADVFSPTDRTTGRRVRTRFPVLLTQDPYSPGLFPPEGFANADWFVPRGYITVEVDVRGTNRSGGPQTAFGSRQAQDGAELVAWAAHRLRGSNGVVGLEGGSYLGINQLLTAARVGPDSPLKAIAPFYAGAETYREPVTDGGIPTSFILSFYEALGFSAHGPNRTDVYRALAETRSGGGQAVYDGSAFKADREPRELAGAIARNHIPALLLSGSADLFPFGSLELYAELQNAAAGRPVYGPMARHQATAGRYQIVFGDYRHGENPDHLLDVLELEWFDTWLKGAKTGLGNTARPMHVLEEGDHRWVNLATYPVVADYTTYNLDRGGSLTRAKPHLAGQDQVTWAPPDAPGASLTYSTAPFPHGATLAGPISATIEASSTARNVELALELDDVDPAGTVTPLTSGSLLGSLRAVDAGQSWRDERGRLIYAYHPFTRGSERRVPLRPTQRFDISIAPRFFAIAPGHSLRLVIQTDVRARSIGVAAGQGLAPTEVQLAQLAGGVYQIHRGPRGGSTVNLPLLPAGAFRSAHIQTGPFDWGP